MLTAYDPFTGASAAFRALDQLTGRQGGMTTARALSGMPMDAYRVGDNFVAHFDLPGGSYLGPDGFQEMRGYPTLVGRTAAAGDPELARRLWGASALLTGVDYPASTAV